MIVCDRYRLTAALDPANLPLTGPPASRRRQRETEAPALGDGRPQTRKRPREGAVHTNRAARRGLLLEPSVSHLAALSTRMPHINMRIRQRRVSRVRHVFRVRHAYRKASDRI